MPGEPVVLGFQTRGTLALPADLRRRHNLDSRGLRSASSSARTGSWSCIPWQPCPLTRHGFGRRWQRMEREADADIAAGRVTTHATVGELFDAFEA